MTNLADLIRTKRQNIGLTQAQVCEELGISAQSFSGMELGNRPVPMKHIRKIMAMLKLSADKIMAAYISDQREKMARQLKRSVK